jgi:hypothetical protein
VQETLPTESEINVHNSLDEQVACRHFFRRSLGEAEALFRDNSLYYSEDLMYMGPVAFRFYVCAAIRYIRSSCSENDSDFVSSFVGLLEFRLTNEPRELAPVAECLASACHYIVTHQDRWEIIAEIYGNIQPRCERLIEVFTAMNGAKAADNH